jgi:hypothetical protein
MCRCAVRCHPIREHADLFAHRPETVRVAHIEPTTITTAERVPIGFRRISRARTVEQRERPNTIRATTGTRTRQATPPWLGSQHTWRQVNRCVVPSKATPVFLTLHFTERTSALMSFPLIQRADDQGPIWVEGGRRPSESDRLKRAESGRTSIALHATAMRPQSPLSEAVRLLRSGHIIEGRRTDFCLLAGYCAPDEVVSAGRPD